MVVYDGVLGYPALNLDLQLWMIGTGCVGVAATYFGSARCRSIQNSNSPYRSYGMTSYVKPQP